jgi:hypothetical protein
MLLSAETADAAMDQPAALNSEDAKQICNISQPLALAYRA